MISMQTEKERKQYEYECYFCGEVGWSKQIGRTEIVGADGKRKMIAYHRRNPCGQKFKEGFKLMKLADLDYVYVSVDYKPSTEVVDPL